MSAKIKVGLVGIGRAAWGMQCPELAERSDLFELVATCDVLTDRNKTAQDKYGSHIKGYDKIESLLEDPHVELVSIATPSTLHISHAKLALQSGKHVFLEKPMTINYEDAIELSEFAKKTKGQLFIRHNRRFEGGFIHIQEVIKSGLLGDVFSIKLNRHKFVGRDDWQAITKLGGGQLLNWGPHIIDHGLHLLDSELVDLWADCKNTVSPGDAEDHVKVIMKGKNQRVVDLEISGGAAFKDNTYTVFGTKGSLISDNKKIKLRYLDPKKPLAKREADPNTPPLGLSYHQNLANEEFHWIEEEYKIKDKEKSVPADIWNHLYAHLRKDIPFPVKMEEALKVIKVIDSIKTGKSLF